MKTKLCILTIVVLTSFSCSQNDKEVPESYIESQPTFFELRHGNWTTNKWVRKPENLKTLHETFKKVGYMNLMGHYLNDDPFILQDLYINKKPYDLIDSLIHCYEHKEIDVTYYREFWSRRENENNDSVVYAILKDIKHSYKSKLSSFELSLNADETKVNDTLYQLLSIEHSNIPLTEDIASKNFEILFDLGFHESAHNLLFECSEYSEIKWKKDDLRRKLITAETQVLPWIEDNEK